jgi:deoxyadenosine/deoxycytidine kinase
VLLERCIHDNLWVFSKLQLEQGRITPDEWHLFLSLYNKLRLITPEPQRYLYCRCPPEVAAQRMRARGRAYEKEIPLAYLQAVDRLYEAWVASLPPAQVVRIDTTRLDQAMARALAAAAEVLDPLHLALIR